MLLFNQRVEFAYDTGEMKKAHHSICDPSHGSKVIIKSVLTFMRLEHAEICKAQINCLCINTFPNQSPRDDPVRLSLFTVTWQKKCSGWAADTVQTIQTTAASERLTVRKFRHLRASLDPDLKTTCPSIEQLREREREQWSFSVAWG